MKSITGKMTVLGHVDYRTTKHNLHCKGICITSLNYPTLKKREMDGEIEILDLKLKEGVNLDDYYTD